MEPRSLFHAVYRLARDGLITPTGTSRDGRRPDRTVYAVSAAAQMSSLRASGLPRLVLLELEYSRAGAQSEPDWVDGLLADLQSGAITWDDPGGRSNVELKEE